MSVRVPISVCMCLGLCVSVCVCTERKTGSGSTALLFLCGKASASAYVHDGKWDSGVTAAWPEEPEVGLDPGEL